MPDYIPEETAQEKITSAINKALAGVAGARSPNQLILNPKLIILDFVMLFTDGENAVSTQTLSTPVVSTDTVTDTDPGRTDTSTSTPGGRTTTTTKGGEDITSTDRDYEEFTD